MALVVDRRKKLLLPVLIGLVLGFLAWNFTRQPEEKGTSRDIPVEMELEDFELVHGSQGRKSWQLKAEKSSYEKEKERIKLFRPNFVFFRPEDDAVIRVSSLHGLLDREKETIQLWPRVRADYEQTRIRADRMEYDDSYQELVFSGHVQIQYPDMQARSGHGVFDLESRTLTLWKEVEVVLGEESEEKRVRRRE
ncbi:MAG: LPS export ABC transporter periplasmic protein LptC [Desulfohalobiaceae bacterium]|nr:LPS export ABC transporter periplasmic protein LptC [Desulfohalobiaceae bacterium]